MQLENVLLACNGAEEKGLEPAHTHIRYIPTRRLGTLMANTDDSGVMLRERIKETHIKCGSGKATPRKSCRSAAVWELARPVVGHTFQAAGRTAGES